MRRKLTWVGLLFILLAGVAYSQNTLTKRLIGNLDIAWSTGGTGAAEVFTYTTPEGYVLSLNKLDATQLKYRAYSGGNSLPVENSATADKVPEAQTYASLSAAVTALGSTQSTLKLLPGNYPVSSDLTIPATVTIKPERGAIFAIATGKTLTINGPLDAGPWQIFSWTNSGAINLAGCPTKTFYWENWGGLPGVANDASATLIKAAASGIGGKILTWGPYSMRIAAPVQFTQTQGFTLQGMDPLKSCIYVDVGAGNNGLTIGVSGTSDAPGTSAEVFNYFLKNFMLVGPANCCKNGIQLSRVIGGSAENINAILGATEYAIVQAGTEHFTAHWRTGQESAYVDSIIPGGAHAAAAGGLRLCQDGFGWQMNSYNKIIYEQTGSFLAPGAIALRLEDVGANIDISGNLEDTQGVGANLIYATDCNNVNIHDIYTERTVDPSVVFERCSKMTFDNVQMGGTLVDSSNDPVPYTQTMILRSCQTTLIRKSVFGALRIEPSCSDTVCEGIAIREPNGLQDFGSNTTYIGGPYQDYSYQPMNQTAPFGENRDNYFTNTLFNRWKTDRPDGWGIDRSNTWTQCGTGLVDTTRHAAAYCALIETGGDTTSPTCTVSTEQLQALLGTTATFSVWTNLPTGQTWDAGTSNFVFISVSVPDWTTGAKVEGQGVNVSAAFLSAHPTYAGSTQWVCTTAGAAGASEPVWSNTSHQGSTITDGTVTWTAQNLGGSSILNQPMATAQADGLWHKKAVSSFVPWNATACNILIYLYEQTGAAKASMYIAEPALTIGATASRGVLAGKNEFASFIQCGANRMDWGDAVPTTGYAVKGDIRWNSDGGAGAISGWKCVTAGNNDGTGTASVWQKLPVTAALP